MLDAGWVKIHRSLWSSPLWLRMSVEQRMVLITCIAMANFSDAEFLPRSGKRTMIKRGSFVATERRIAMLAGVSRGAVTRALARMEADHFAILDRSQGYTIITINNYTTYQSGEKTESQDESQTRAKREPDIRRKEGKNDTTYQSTVDSATRSPHYGSSPTGTKSRRNTPSDTAYRFADGYRAHLIAIQPHIKAADDEQWARLRHGWAAHFDELLGRTSVSEDDVHAACAHALEDPYWSSRIVTSKQLLTSFDTILAQARAPRRSAMRAVRS